jgi:ABC-type multidrug transport system fused ATPase/permease subunit
LRGIDEVRAYGRERAIAGRWLAEFRRHQADQRLGVRLEAAASAVVAALPVLVFGAVILFVEPTKVGPGGFLVAAAAAAQLVLALGRIDHIYRLVFVVAPDIVRPLRISELPVGAPPGRLSGEIELVDVSYRYPGMPMPVAAVRSVSTRIRAGELVVLTGPSGAGKSTVLNLLAGSIAPTSGVVKLDGTDLAGLDLAAVRAQLGAMPQRLWAPRGTVRSVVAGAKGSEDSAWTAAETVGIASYIRTLPMGLSTVVTDGDGGFSRGQLQRMLLARALARDPRVLLLDDPTSALDLAAASEIERVIAALPITRIVVTRSAELLRRADRVIVLAAGQVDTVIEGEMSCVGQFDSSAS